jgi:ABC-type transport system involved in cytochrome c biogenesis ATPase subunit
LYITGVEGVNQLASGQRLEFLPVGLTIVYGENGAGKSGYARILKRACRARHAGDIQPNVFAEPHIVKRPSAKIGHAIASEPKEPIHWTNEPRPHPVLSAVSVFDSDCADVHLRGENEVAFRPFGLDVPDELARACQALKAALSNEQEELQRRRNPIFLSPAWRSTTTVGRTLSTLNAETDKNILTKLAELTSEELERHRRLTEDLSKDPLQAINEKRAVADAIARLARSFESVIVANQDQPLKEIKHLSDIARSKRTAAKIAADKVFAGTVLAGVGGAVWQTLWNAARAYSERVGAPGQAFPPAQSGSACPLCHQPLGDEEVERLRGFQEYIETDTERQATNAEAAFSQAYAKFNAERVCGKMFAADRMQLALQDSALAARILRTLATARLRRQQCSKSLANDQPLTLTGFADNPIPDLKKLERDLRAYVEELVGATDPAARKRLKDELAELADRKALKGYLPVVTEEIQRLKLLGLISECIRDTTTTAITNLGNDIADRAITPAMRDRFQNEIVELAANRIRVEIVRSGGKFGSPQYQVRLFSNPGAKVHVVLSEGEQTCVALAAFLTELATAGHQSTLVFDDPVSSLDHKWRRQVASRLVKEAKERQIVVFTHDLVFVNDLTDDAIESKVSNKTITISRGGAGAGVVTEGLPWDAARVEDRLDKLEKDARAAKATFDAHDDDAYRAQVRSLYDRLRSTWERALEQVAFSKIVLRHRDYIDTKHLKRVTVLNEADCDQFAAGFKNCCDQITAHDPSLGRNASPPLPAVLIADVKALSQWVAGIRERQKKFK